MTGATCLSKSLYRKQHPPRVTPRISRLLLVVKHSIVILHNQGQRSCGNSTKNCVFCNIRVNFWKTAYITQFGWCRG